MDINNIKGLLRTGSTKGEGSWKTLTTPVGRVRWANLGNNPDTFKGVSRHKATMLFETDPALPGCVDVDKCVSPWFAEMFEVYDLHPVDSGGEMKIGTQTIYQVGVATTAGGDPISGYSKSTFSLTAKHKIQDPDKHPVTYYNAQGKKCESRDMYEGCYARMVISMYRHPDNDNPSIILKSIQFVGDGEKFISEDMGMDAIPGSDAVAEIPDGDLGQFIK